VTKSDDDKRVGDAVNAWIKRRGRADQPAAEPPDPDAPDLSGHEAMNAILRGKGRVSITRKDTPNE
jgi:hypothetical protein